MCLGGGDYHGKVGRVQQVVASCSEFQMIKYLLIENGRKFEVAAQVGSYTPQALLYPELFFQVVIGTTGYFFGWLGGYLYDNFPHSTFIYYGMVCGYVVLVTLVLMQVFASCYSSNTTDDGEEEPVQSCHDKCCINSNTEQTQL